MSDPDISTRVILDLQRSFRNYKTLAERALAQVPDADLHRPVDADANSIAVVIKHIAGNLRSRFTDFLTTDGEKPDRNRDTEFEVTSQPSRDEVMRWWEAGWAPALASIDALTPADLERTVHIRGEAYLVIEALNRSIAHTAYHVGQIVLLAKQITGPAWTSLTIPRGQSASYMKGDVKTKGLAR